MGSKTSPTTYGLLGLLAVRSWTGYELTQQLRRSLRYVWSASEGHLYREQAHLVELGWATVEDEPAGKRTRKRYAITPMGRTALEHWLETEPGEPQFAVEGILRLFYGDQGSVSDLTASMRTTANSAQTMLDEMTTIVGEYLGEGGPLTMLEERIGGPAGERLEYQGRPQYPERLHVIALTLDITTRLLAEVETFFSETAEETAKWTSASGSELTKTTRQRLEMIRDRHKPK